MRKIIINLLVAATLSSFGCASILNGKYQKVVINTPSPHAKVFVDNELAGTGQTVVAKMRRDMHVRQIRMEMENCKPEYRVHYQTRKSPIYIASWIPFGAMLLLPPMYDAGPKSFNYAREVTLRANAAPLKRSSDQKYLLLEKTTLDLSKNNFSVQSTSVRRYQSSKKMRKGETNKEDIRVDNTIFTDQLNTMLKNYGFLDTTRTVLQSRMNTMYLQARVDELTLINLHDGVGQYTENFFVIEATTTWVLKDVYGQEKYSVKLKNKSGEISSDFYKQEVAVKTAVGDAISQSFHELLARNEVQKLLQLEKAGEAVSMPGFTIAQPRQVPSNVEEAMNATVTIKHKQGHGSGCLVTADGYVVTNFHVIAGVDDFQVLLKDGQAFKARLVRKNEPADLALLKIDTDQGFAYLIPKTKNYSIGQEVFAIGTPTSVDLGQTVSKGIISGIRKLEKNDMLQTDVSVNPGNSGGALINAKGELIGIVNSKITGMGVEGIAFCIPASDVIRLLNITY